MEAISDLDAFLIDNYHPPHDMHHSGIGAGHKIFASNEHMARVYQAYSRLSRRQRVYQWFEERGFDLGQGAIQKTVFERHLAAARAAASPKITTAMIDDHVLVDPKLGIDSKMAHPTQDACVKAWKAKYESAARDRVRDRYNKHAKDRGIPVKPGPRSNSAK